MDIQKIKNQNEAICQMIQKRDEMNRLMVAHVERIARERGARFVMWHTRAGTKLAGVLRKRGYTDADTVVMKEL